MTPIFDRIIDLTLTYTDKKTFKEDKSIRDFSTAITSGMASVDDSLKHQKQIKIKCPRSGRKPKIEFKYSRVEGNVVYDCKITISNLYLTIDAIWVDTINVTAGYNYPLEQTDSFVCLVFAAYTPQPGPDGYTVFDCIIARAASFKLQEMFSFAVFNTKPMPVVKNEKGELMKTAQGKWTVRSVLTETCAKLQMTCIMYAPDFIADAPFTLDDIPPEQHKGALAVIGFLQRRMNDIGQAYDTPFQVATLVFDDTVYFIGISPESKVELTENITRDKLFKLYDMNQVSSADWNAGVLTITAPWIPQIRPGSMFRIFPTMYNGSDLPNIISRTKEQKDYWDIYYVLQEDVVFSTEGENSMTIMAIPFKYSPANTLGTDSEADLEHAKDIRKKQEDLKNVVTTIQFGENSLEVEAAEEQVKDISALSLTLPSTSPYIIQPGDKLIKIVEAKLQLPKLVGILNGQEVTIPASQAWYPIILLQTATTYTSKRIPTYAKYAIDAANPDYIVEGRYLDIPEVSWSYLYQSYKSKCIQIYKSCYEYYKKNPNTSDWAKTCKNCADLFEKGVIQ